jgi:hypothetical protein
MSDVDIGEEGKKTFRRRHRKNNEYTHIPTGTSQIQSDGGIGKRKNPTA